jgi:phosphatidylinositol glycan class T
VGCSMWRILFVLVCFSCGADVLKEKLVLRPLLDGKILSHFSFSISSPSGITSPHYNLVPKSLGHLVASHNVSSIRLSLGAGRWYSERWGLPSFAAPEGLLVSGTFSSSESASSWERLLGGLGGLIGAPMSLLAKSGHTAVLADGTFLAASGGEPVCTENLTPWLSMLPCRDRAGFGSLLDPLKIFATSHHALGVSVDVDSESGSLVLSFDIAFVSNGQNAWWNSQTLFGKPFLSSCGLAAETRVDVDLRLTGEGDATATRMGSYVITRGEKFDFKLPNTRRLAEYGGVWAMRFLSGWGLEKGGVKTVVLNRGENSQSFDLLEIVPWYFRVDAASVMSSDASASVLVLDSEERSSPCVIEVKNVTVPANSSVVLSYTFSKAFLHLSEHPPNAHHGFYLPAARIKLTKGGEEFYTEGYFVCCYLGLFFYFCFFLSSSCFATCYARFFDAVQRCHIERYFIGIFLWVRARDFDCAILVGEEGTKAAKHTSAGETVKAHLVVDRQTCLSYIVIKHMVFNNCNSNVKRAGSAVDSVENKCRF